LVELQNPIENKWRIFYEKINPLLPPKLLTKNFWYKDYQKAGAKTGAIMGVLGGGICFIYFNFLELTGFWGFILTPMIFALLGTGIGTLIGVGVCFVSETMNKLKNRRLISIYNTKEKRKWEAELQKAEEDKDTFLYKFYTEDVEKKYSYDTLKNITCTTDKFIKLINEEVVRQLFTYTHEGMISLKNLNSSVMQTIFTKREFENISDEFLADEKTSEDDLYFLWSRNYTADRTFDELLKRIPSEKFIALFQNDTEIKMLWQALKKQKCEVFSYPDCDDKKIAKMIHTYIQKEIVRYEEYGHWVENTEDDSGFDKDGTPFGRTTPTHIWVVDGESPVYGYTENDIQRIVSFLNQLSDRKDSILKSLSEINSELSSAIKNWKLL